MGAVLLQALTGLPPHAIRVRIGERWPQNADTLRAQEERLVVSAALGRLVMESFPLFSPRTTDAPCTGTERPPGVPLGVLQEAFGEAVQEERCSQPRVWGSSPGSSHLLQLPKGFLDLCRQNSSMIRRESMGLKTGKNEQSLPC